jgi:hypothetical protein
VLTPWTETTLDQLLGGAGLEGAVEEPLPTDGWSGATFSILRRSDGARFVLKRDALAANWIARATADVHLREAVAATAFAAREPRDLGALEPPYLGAARDGGGAAILMPDLSQQLLAWERPSFEPGLTEETLGRIVDVVARLHVTPWALGPWAADEPNWPWCPLRERLLLLSRPAAAAYAAEGNPVGATFLDGWDAFDRLAGTDAVELIRSLSTDPAPLLDALGRLPSVGLHGDLKLSNVALLPGDRVALIDWQMTLRAPIAVELGWFLVSNVALLPLTPGPLFDAFHEALRWHVGRWGSADQHDWDGFVGDWEAQVDLAWIVGLLLRGWRKGADAAAGLTHPSGVAAMDDLREWGAMAVQAARRRFRG